MGIADKFKATVLTVYKADTSQQRSEIKKLKKAQEDQADSANKGIDGQLAMLAKAGAAVGAVVAAYKLAEVGLEAYEKRSRLMASTVGVDLKGLQSATKGLVSETRLLEFASKAMNGTFKLSQAQMEQAVTGAVALRKTLGVDLQKALEVTQKSITEGTTEPLKELGLVVKGVENDTREGLNAALKELAQQARLAGPDLAIPGDEMSRSQVKMANSVDQLKISLGELAQSLAPVISELAEMVGLLAQASTFIFGGKSLHSQAMAALNDDAFNKNRRNGFSSLVGNSLGRDTRSPLPGDFGSAFSGAGAGASAGISKRRRSGTGGGYTLGNSANLSGGLDIDPGGYTGANSLGHANIANGNRSVLAAGEEGRLATIGASEAARSLSESLAAIEVEKHQNLLQGIFGVPSEIDAQTVAITQMAGAFDGLANAFGSGVDALITGSESFASAFKNAIGESLRAMAVEMSISAVKHTAYGLGSLAFGDARGATTHFAAAAQFGAGALAAGVGANLMGAGRPASVGAGTAGVGSASPSNDNDSSGKTVVNIIGRDFAMMNDHQRAAQFRTISREAGMEIDGDVAFNG